MHSSMSKMLTSPESLSISDQARNSSSDSELQFPKRNQMFQTRFSKIVFAKQNPWDPAGSAIAIAMVSLRGGAVFKIFCL